MRKDELGLLDTKAVATHLGVHCETVWRAVREGRIEALGFRVVRLKRRLRFERLELWRSTEGMLMSRHEWRYQLDLD